MSGFAAGLERLRWDGEAGASIDGVRFRRPDLARAGEDSGAGDSFALLKDEPIIRAYLDYGRDRPAFAAANVFELGLWDGGSIALWHQVLEPSTHVGVDLRDRRTSYFERYLAEDGRADRIHTYWDVDQSDRERLAEIARRHFTAPLDLVLDDGSHLYGPTRASMEVLLPLLRPGGLYVIEDWAWGHWGEEYRLHRSPERQALTRLAAELAGIVGSSQEIVSWLDVRRPFLVIERGAGAVDGPLDLDSLRSWRRGAASSPAAFSARRYLGALRRRLPGGNASAGA